LSNYAANLGYAQRAWEEGNIAHLLEILERQGPKYTKQDLRGFEWYYWRHLCRFDKFPDLDHAGPVKSLAVSPAGKWLAAAGGNEIRGWDAAEKFNPFDAWKLENKAEVSTIAFHPDSTRIAVALADKSVSIWMPRQHERKSWPTGHKGEITAVALSP